MAERNDTTTDPRFAHLERAEQARELLERAEAAERALVARHADELRAARVPAEPDSVAPLSVTDYLAARFAAEDAYVAALAAREARGADDGRGL